MLKRTNLVKSRFNLKNFNSNFFPVAFMSFFVFAQIFDGVNAFGIKWVSGVLLVILVAFHALRSEKVITRNWFIFTLLIAFLPLYGLFISSINGGLNKFSDTSQLSFAILLFSTIYFHFGDNARLVIKIMIFNLRLLAFLIIAVFLFIFFGDYYPSFFLEKQILVFGERGYGGVTFNYIYFISSPLLLFLVAYDSYSLNNRVSFFKLFMLLLTICALFLSGTRALIVFAIFSFFFVSFWVGPLTIKFFYTVVAFLTTVLILYFYPDVAFSMFSEANSASKLSYFNGYWEILNNLKYFFFGQGFNAHTWSAEFLRMLSSVGNQGIKTELTYIELMRVYGVPMGSIVIILLFSLPFKRNVSREYQWLKPAMLMYLILAATNPYIFSSNGALALGVYLGFLNINKRVRSV